MCFATCVSYPARRACRSIGPNARERGYLAGTLDLGANEPGEFVRRTRPCLRALAQQLFVDFGKVENAHDFRADLIDDWHGRRGRYKRSPPVLILVNRQASFSRGAVVRPPTRRDQS